ncbi:hypothetical protein SBDP2_1880010 [Syntrophobacter sp. SbD2]|nr:hypothetical protein SBDP2_1880010 [Syntrophobacter sp. SbD2]
MAAAGLMRSSQEMSISGVML